MYDEPTTSMSAREAAAADEDASRTFRGPSPRAALDAVKAALGGDAIIVSTREVKGPYGPSVIEIVARSPDAPARSSRPISAARPSRPLMADDGFLLAPPTAGRDGASPWIQHLCERGIAEQIARRMVERAGRIPSRTPRTLRDSIPEVIHEMLEVAPAPWEPARARQRRIVALVGPTGVGKTTTIAKIAARALIDSKLKVALITVDTWRIGAVDHLRRYGEIMNVPTYVARDARALREVIERCQGIDLVLIDTAGRSPAESETFTVQLELLRATRDIEIHLAVSAGTSLKQLRTLRERYASLEDTRLIVTKLDEADGPGSVLNAAAMLSRPLACVTDGQRVPEDLHAGDADRVGDEVLGA